MAEDASTGRAKALRMKRLAKEWEGYSTRGISGWCIDDLHRKCKHKFIYSECTCTCHGTDKTPRPEPEQKPVKRRRTTAKKKTSAPRAGNRST